MRMPSQSVIVRPQLSLGESSNPGSREPLASNQPAPLRAAASSTLSRPLRQELGYEAVEVRRAVVPHSVGIDVSGQSVGQPVAVLVELTSRVSARRDLGRASVLLRRVSGLDPKTFDDKPRRFLGIPLFLCSREEPSDPFEGSEKSI